MSELEDLRRAVEKRRKLIEEANASVDRAMMRAYRAERPDGTPQFTLTEIGRTLGVSRQRVYQLVRETAGRAQ